MDSGKKKEAFVTLATNDIYCKGVRVLAQSLRVNNTTKDLVVMVTPQVTKDERPGLKAMFDVVMDVDVMDSKDATHLAMLKRPELGVTFTKLHCWTLTQYSKCVFMDADTMVLTNIDELFDREELSAAPDSGWPDIFNSGVFVYKPSIETYHALINAAETVGSFDGGDQGLLNTYFNGWLTDDITKHLSFLYNMHSTSTYTYSPAFARFGHNTKVVHFIGAVKPWHHMYDRVTGTLYQAEGSGVHEERFIREWWSLYYLCEDFLHPDEPGPSKPPIEEKFHQWMWKTDQIDFTGKDRYEIIQAKMDQIISEKIPSPPPSETPSQKSNLLPDNHPARPSSVESTDITVEENVTVSISDISDDDIAIGDPNHIEWLPLDDQPGRSDVDRFESWKAGSVDFMGDDQFANIQSRIDRLINLESPQPAIIKVDPPQPPIIKVASPQSPIIKIASPPPPIIKVESPQPLAINVGSSQSPLVSDPATIAVT